MGSRQVFMSICAVFSIILILNTGPYNIWLHQKILSFTEEIYDQVDNMDYEYRKESRLKASYIMAQNLKRRMVQHDSTLKSILLLIPPQSYFDNHGFNLLMPEPIMLYAYSGVKAALPTSKNVYQANYGLQLTGGDLRVIDIHSRATIDSLLTEYKTIKR